MLLKYTVCCIFLSKFVCNNNSKKKKNTEPLNGFNKISNLDSKIPLTSFQWMLQYGSMNKASDCFYIEPFF